MTNMSERVMSKNLDLVITSIQVARIAGGNLPQVFEDTATAIREISRLEAKIQTMTAQGKLQALVLGALVASIRMLAIGDNLARGLGILGTMALVRFRTNVRDARDMIFIFAALAVGVACGVQAYSIALTGTIVFSAACYAVDWTPFGRRQRFDGMLRFWLPREGVGGEEIRAALTPHCRTFALVALRDVAQNETLEYAYQVKLHDPEAQDSLVRALGALPGIDGLTLMLQDAHTEL